MLDRISTPVAEYDLRKTHAALEPAAGSTTTRFLIAARETDDASRHLPSNVRVFRIDHSVQVRCGIFDVEVLALARPAFRCQHSATMDVFKITIREFVPSLGILVLLLVAKYHFAYFLNPSAARNSFSVYADGRCSLHGSLSSNTERPATMSSLTVECCPIQFHRHDTLSFARSQRSSALFDFLRAHLICSCFARPAFPTITRLS